MAKRIIGTTPKQDGYRMPAEFEPQQGVWLSLIHILPRFPTFAVRIRKGAFWYYLEHNSAPGPF